MYSPLSCNQLTNYIMRSGELITNEDAKRDSQIISNFSKQCCFGIVWSARLIIPAYQGILYSNSAADYGELYKMVSALHRKERDGKQRNVTIASLVTDFRPKAGCGCDVLKDIYD